MLGHHIELSTKSATTYNRDPQLLLQAKVSKVLNMVIDGRLDPDASRARRLSKLMNYSLYDDQGHGDEDSDESDFEDTDVASIHSKIHMGERPAVPLEQPDEYNFVAHKLTGTVHVLQDEDVGRLACGRLKTKHGTGWTRRIGCRHSSVLHPMQCSCKTWQGIILGTAESRRRLARERKNRFSSSSEYGSRKK